MRRTTPLVTCLAVLVSGPLAGVKGLAQDPAQLPQFDVATVKLADPNRRDVGLYTYLGGRVVAHAYTVQALIAEAYEVRIAEVSGGPSWIGETRFDIEAKPPETSVAISSNPPSPKARMSAEQREMLRSLLEDRFSLQVHRTSAQRPVFLLERTGKPLKLVKPENDKAFPGQVGSITRGDGLAGKNISMTQLATRLSDAVGRPVLDQTGLNGSFEFIQGGDQDTETDVPSTVIRALPPLGLRLRSSAAPVPTIVVDRVKKPTPN